MPQNKYALARYYLIDNLLQEYHYVKTKFIVECCKERMGYSISSRTIQMDIAAMKNDDFLGFYAPIDYSVSRKAYYYKDSSYRLLPFGITKLEVHLLEAFFEDHCMNLKKENMDLLHSLINRLKIFQIE